MRLKFAAYLLLGMSAIVVSCKKDDVTPDDQQNPQVNTQFVRLQQGLDPESDTVYLIKYDAQKRIQSVLDSAYEDELTATYDAKGNLSETENGFYGPATFTYNADNQLTEVYVKDEPARYTFEYTNGVISKKSYFVKTNTNNPNLNLWRSYTYTVKDGNITSIKEYNSVGTFVSEMVFTYTNQPNIFKPYALINFTNFLGLYDLANEDYYFNNNLIESITEGQQKTTYTYTYDSKKQLTKVVVKNTGGEYEDTWTRMFAY